MKTRKQTSKGDIYIINVPIYTATFKMLDDGTPIPSSVAKLIFIPTTRESFIAIIPNQAGLVSAQLDTYLTNKQNFIKQTNLQAVLPKQITYLDKFSLK
jgi:hypothetical protein